MRPGLIVFILAALTLVFGSMAHYTQGSERAFTLFSALATATCSGLLTYIRPRKEDATDD